MTLRQWILKKTYPLLMWVSKKTGKERIVQNKAVASPPVSFYSLSVTLNNGKELSFETLRNKKVLLVNTASNCGYTAQYAELQKLYQHAKEDVEIIAFPANDFKEQEESGDEEIAQFCAVNFGVSFPLSKKTVVVKEAGQHPVYKWLTNSQLNGWNNKIPTWNFAKFLVSEEGVLTHYFSPAVSPLQPEVIGAVHT